MLLGTAFSSVVLLEFRHFIFRGLWFRSYFNGIKVAINPRNLQRKRLFSSGTWLLGTLAGRFAVERLSALASVTPCKDLLVTDATVRGEALGLPGKQNLLLSLLQGRKDKKEMRDGIAMRLNRLSGLKSRKSRRRLRNSPTTQSLGLNFFYGIGLIGSWFQP